MEIFDTSYYNTVCDVMALNRYKMETSAKLVCKRRATQVFSLGST
jgi:hypothetical protein